MEERRQGSLEDKVLTFIRQEKMIAPGTLGIVAVSGGADSVCLLHVLSHLAGELDTGFAVCHVMHGIRGEEAKRDAEHVRMEAEKLGLSCRIYEKDVPAYAAEHGISLEEAGRIIRYGCLNEYKEEIGADWIALAHQKEDQEETILFHILRGTGLRGLRGIRPVQGDRIRPLLRTDRARIEDWLKEQGIEYCTDSTNLESEYSRNKLRNRILPELREINAGVGEHLLSLAQEAEELYDIQEAATEKLHLRCSGRDGNGAWRRFDDPQEAPGSVTAVLLPSGVKESGTAVLGELILREMESLSGKRKDLTRRHISAVEELFGRETGKMLNLPYGITAVRTYQGVELRKGGPAETPGVELRKGSSSETPGDDRPDMEDPGLRLRITRRPYRKGEEIPDGRERVLIDADAVRGEPCLRTPMKGDTITVLAGGGRKALTRFFTDRKIPAEQREDYPVVADEAGILWVVGLRLSEHCRISEHTTEVYEIEVINS